MKIALASMYLPSGSKIGVGYVVHYFANEMVKRGHDVTVYSQTGACDDSLYKVNVVPSGSRLRTFGFAWNLRHVDFMQYDVLNAHGDDWFLWGRKRPRHVHTFHGSCLAEMMNVRGIKERARMAVLALCEANACLLAQDLVAVSANTKRYIPGIRHVIPNGVSLSQFAPTSAKSDRPAVLFVGTMHGRKRGQMLLDLFKTQIRPTVPDAEFWAVCENPIEGDGVQWFGRVPTEVLCDLYRRAWVFCLPSTYEGFGVPYIEAMASGTAVVATPNVGAREVTAEGVSGLVVPDAELGPTIIRVLQDEDLRRRLEAAGLRRAQDFSWERVCAQYEALYRGDYAKLQEVSAT